MSTNVCLWCYWPAGPPDVEQPCEPSLQAWSPELSLYDTNVTSPCPETEGCTLTLTFLHPVVPHALTLWVTYISSSEYSSITVSLHQLGMSDMIDCTTLNVVHSIKSSWLWENSVQLVCRACSEAYGSRTQTASDTNSLYPLSHGLKEINNVPVSQTLEMRGCSVVDRGGSLSKAEI